MRLNSPHFVSLTLTALVLSACGGQHNTPGAGKALVLNQDSVRAEFLQNDLLSTPDWAWLDGAWVSEKDARVKLSIDRKDNSFARYTWGSVTVEGESSSAFINCAVKTAGTVKVYDSSKKSVGQELLETVYVPLLLINALTKALDPDAPPLVTVLKVSSAELINDPANDKDCPGYLAQEDARISDKDYNRSDDYMGIVKQSETKFIDHGDKEIYDKQQ